MSDKTTGFDNLIKLLYRAVLRREAQGGEVQAYAAALEAGRSVASVVEDFVGSDEFTPMLVPPGHFYSPIVDPREARAFYASLGEPAQTREIAGVTIDRDAMLREHAQLLPFLADIPFKAQPSPGLRYAFDNPAYAWADGSILHAMLRSRRPRRLVEIGGGWSSACTIDTIERYLGSDCDVTFIDPYPDLTRALVGETAVNVRTLACRVQDVPLSVFTDLQANDILFIDSTHVAKTGSDVCFEILEILPRLRPGVMVHFHDVFWPFEYPAYWIVDEGRSWNELYVLRAFLSGNPAWRIVYFNHYMSLFAHAEIAATYPDFLKNPGGALWLTRRA